MKPLVWQHKKGYFEVGFSSQEKYPAGTYLAQSFNSAKEAQDWIEEHPDELKPGIPLCKALIDWRELHGM